MNKDTDPFRDFAPEYVMRMLSPKKLGRYNELKVVYAIEVLKPWWYMEVCWADDREDRCGIDLWIRHVMMGWVPFQVKSSKTGFRSHVQQGNKHEKEGGDKIPCVISNFENTLSDIVRQIDDGFRFERTQGFFAKRKKAFTKLKR